MNPKSVSFKINRIQYSLKITIKILIFTKKFPQKDE